MKLRMDHMDGRYINQFFLPSGNLKHISQLNMLYKLNYKYVILFGNQKFLVPNLDLNPGVSNLDLIKFDLEFWLSLGNFSCKLNMT